MKNILQIIKTKINKPEISAEALDAYIPEGGKK